MSWVLDEGDHKRPEDGVCLMEAVAWVAGEQHSDKPACACPVFASYGRALNDKLPHEKRQQLARFVPRLVDSRATRDVQRQRAFAFVDAAVRVYAARALDDDDLPTWARRLRELRPLTGMASAMGAKSVVDQTVEVITVKWRTLMRHAEVSIEEMSEAEIAAVANHGNALRCTADAVHYATNSPIAYEDAVCDAARAICYVSEDAAIALFDQLLPPAAVSDYAREPAKCPAWRA